MNSDKILDDAIAFAAEQWQQATTDRSVPPNTNLRDRVTIFASPFQKALLAKFPDLRAADEQVLLLVVAEGIARSGTVERGKLERTLGIILPPAR